MEKDKKPKKSKLKKEDKDKKEICEVFDVEKDRKTKTCYSRRDKKAKQNFRKYFFNNYSFYCCTSCLLVSS